MNTNKPTTETNKTIDALCAERDAYKAKCVQLNAKIQKLSALVVEREEQLSALTVALNRAEKRAEKYVKALRLIAQAVELSELAKEI